MKIYICPLLVVRIVVDCKHHRRRRRRRRRCFSSADLYTVSINVRKSLWAAAQPLSLLYKENKTCSNLSQSTASSALRFFGRPPPASPPPSEKVRRDEWDVEQLKDFCLLTAQPHPVLFFTSGGSRRYSTPQAAPTELTAHCSLNRFCNPSHTAAVWQQPCCRQTINHCFSGRCDCN